MGLARKPPLHLFRNQLGLHLGQQRPSLRKGKAQVRKATVRALNDGQSCVIVMAGVATFVDQPGFDD
jgi:hypothetical protein